MGSLSPSGEDLSPPPPPVTHRKARLHPDPFVVEPTKKHTHTLILLHGLGSTGHKFGSEFIHSATPSSGSSLPKLLPGWKFIFPTALKRRSAAFNRATLHQWFNVALVEDFGYKEELQAEGLTESGRYLRDILKTEIEGGIIAENVVLGGLSQGCAMSLFLLLGLDHQIGGLVGMSGRLPHRKAITQMMGLADGCGSESENDLVEFEDDDSDGRGKDLFLQVVDLVREVSEVPSNLETNVDRDRTCWGTPIFLGHGEKDEKVSCKLGEEAAQILRALGMDVAWKSYADLGHWYQVPEEIDDILEFLRTKLGLDSLNS